jgi:hypothetical protein
MTRVSLLEYLARDHPLALENGLRIRGKAHRLVIGSRRSFAEKERVSVLSALIDLYKD